MNKVSPSSVSNEGGEEAADKLLKTWSVRVDDTVIYNVLIGHDKAIGTQVEVSNYLGKICHTQCSMLCMCLRKVA